MAVDLISLRKLMQLILATERQRTSLLRSNIRDDLKRALSGPGEGGDFHTAFWADAKGHVAGTVDLRESTPRRVGDHRGRRRLYPLLADGFLQWWEERRRRRNEPFQIMDARIRGRFALEGLGTVKVESNLGVSIGRDTYRVVYPYFCEEPALTADVARLGLWAMSQALPSYDLENLRVLDVLRGASFSTIECPLTGTEEEAFRQSYSSIIDRWNVLRREY